MNKLMKNQLGFTLIELMITIVIVGVLATVAIPLYQANVKRAKGTEADATMGSIRTALRVHYAENSDYPIEASYVAVHTLTDSIDIDSTDMLGKYFPATAYTYISDGVTYTLRATGSGQSAGIQRQMTSAGIFVELLVCVHNARTTAQCSLLRIERGPQCFLRMKPAAPSLRS